MRLMLGCDLYTGEYGGIGALSWRGTGGVDLTQVGPFDPALLSWEIFSSPSCLAQL